MSQSLGASLGARFAVSSQANIEKRKKRDPKNRTLSCAATSAQYDAVGMLANKLNVSRSRAVEIAVEELLAKHCIKVQTDND